MGRSAASSAGLRRGRAFDEVDRRRWVAHWVEHQGSSDVGQRDGFGWPEESTTLPVMGVRVAITKATATIEAQAGGAERSGLMAERRLRRWRASGQPRTADQHQGYAVAVDPKTADQ